MQLRDRLLFLIGSNKRSDVPFPELLEKDQDSSEEESIANFD